MKIGPTPLSRRNFLMGTSALAAARVIGKGSAAAGQPDGIQKKPLVASLPALQNPAETSIGISFQVSALASGWVELGEKSDLSDAKRFFTGARGLMALDENVVQVRIAGLKRATRYFYRIGADRIDYVNGYSMKNLGFEREETIYSFTTLGAAGKSRFAVIGDTHENRDALNAAFATIAKLDPAAVVWNGDATNSTETMEKACEIFLAPTPKHRGYAAETPYFFVPGNHDFRGRAARKLEEVVMLRDCAERSGRFAELGRNFVERIGDIALIGLDTGEDKLDTNPIFAGIFRMDAYRRLQAEWLSEAIESPRVKSAKFKVACCHIPLFDSAPDANPGDIFPNDTDRRYRTDFAVWQRQSAQLWGPSLAKAGVQLVIAGHQHAYRFDAPDAGRPWAQMIGAGFGMVIDVHVDNARLVVRAIDGEGKIVDERVFA